jgi:hypothetical protein
MRRIAGPNSAFLTGGQPGNALHASSPLPFPPSLLRFPLVLPDRNAYGLTSSLELRFDSLGLESCHEDPDVTGNHFRQGRVSGCHGRLGPVHLLPSRASCHQSQPIGRPALHLS